MIHALLISSDQAIQHCIEGLLQKFEDIKITRALTRWKALDLLAQQGFQLAIVDETVGNQPGLDLTKKLVTLDPMMNCVLISSLSEEEFHEATEGLGILSQLPTQPDAADLDQMVAKLRKILNQIS